MLEGLKAYKTEDGNILLFRPGENGMRLCLGAERMCMASPSVDQFVKAVKDTVLANEKWVIQLHLSDHFISACRVTDINFIILLSDTSSWKRFIIHKAIAYGEWFHA